MFLYSNINFIINGKIVVVKLQKKKQTNTHNKLYIVQKEYILFIKIISQKTISKHSILFKLKVKYQMLHNFRL